MAFSRTVSFCQALLTSRNPSVRNVIVKCAAESSGIHTSSVLSGKMRFILQGLDMDKYTTKPLPYSKNGGRDFKDGRVTNKRIGGGHRQKWRWVDYKRVGPKAGPPLVEKVQEVMYDPHRSGNIALVASGNSKRYILASDTMKPGDLIKTSGEIPDIPVKAEACDAFPVGALPAGTVIHNIEYWPDEGGRIARAAGSCGMVVRKMENMVVVRMPSGQEICVAETCMATVGRVSNAEQNKQPMGSPNRMRWFGIRPRSGKRNKKIGIHGKKTKNPKPIMIFDVTKRGSLNKNSVFDLD